MNNNTEINHSDFENAYKLWEDFKSEVTYKNRFFIEHDVMKYLEQFAKTNSLIIPAKTILYRARQFEDDLATRLYYNDLIAQNGDNSEILLTATYQNDKSMFRREPGFWGYSKDKSFIPPDNNYVSDGRANPAFIKYLYTAEDAYTAMVEVRPYLGSVISIAEIRVLTPLSIVNFTYESLMQLQGFEECLMYLIINDFSKPSNSDKRSYLPTQYISEFIKSINMDGIRFKSSLYERGRNVTIFNYENCEPVCSYLYKLDDICFEAKGVSPKGKSDLLHYKLHKARQKESTNLINRYLKNDNEE